MEWSTRIFRTVALVHPNLSSVTLRECTVYMGAPWHLVAAHSARTAHPECYLSVLSNLGEDGGAVLPACLSRDNEPSTISR